MREIKKIIIHCSDSLFGDARAINSWHTSDPFNFNEIGYHYVILNGKRHSNDEYSHSIDGTIETGRALFKVGAHCQGDNTDSIGICLIGISVFTDKQFDNLLALIERLRERFGLLPVYGHCEMKSGIKQGKTCPNFDVEAFRTEYRLHA